MCCGLHFQFPRTHYQLSLVKYPVYVYIYYTILYYTIYYTIFIYAKDRMIKVVFLVAYIKIYQDLYFFYINHWCESDTGEHILFLVLSDRSINMKKVGAKRLQQDVSLTGAF
jgi:hypothetical protein